MYLFTILRSFTHGMNKVPDYMPSRMYWRKFSKFCCSPTVSCVSPMCHLLLPTLLIILRGQFLSRVPVYPITFGCSFKRRLVVLWPFRLTRWPICLATCCLSFLCILLLVAVELIYSPICVIPQVLRFLRSTVASFTIVIPDIQPHHFWRCLMENNTSSSIYLARKSTPDVVLPPSKDSYNANWPLPWDLWTFHIKSTWL